MSFARNFTFFENILHHILRIFFKRREIWVKGRLYLVRYYLKGRGTDAQYFLHHIILPDEGVEMHDHPWAFRTEILSGEYREELPTCGNKGCTYCVRKRTHKAGDFYSVPATHVHRIDHVERGTWTLVKTGPATRTWGFWVDNGRRWVDWRTYLGKPPETPDLPEDEVR